MDAYDTLFGSIFLGIAALNMGYYLFFFFFAFAKANPQTTESTPSEKDLLPVSVIVCAKNEAANLQQNIPQWLSQEYPEFQLVLINDASQDNSLEIMEDFAKQDARIKVVDVVNVEAFWGNKKYALTLGVKAAAYEHLLLTDADCHPASSSWIRQMTAPFHEGYGIVLGYGAYLKQKKSWLNTLIRYETLLTALQYFAHALGRRPYMGVGRNLAYTRDLFYEQRGFINHIKIRSGDDDLFVNQAATKKNTACIFHEHSFTLSQPKTTWSSWITQKRRHVDVARYYRWSDQLLLGVFYSSQLLLFITLVVAAAVGTSWVWLLGGLSLRYLIAWIAVGKAAVKLDEKDLIKWFPLCELFLIFMQLSIFKANLIAKPNRWK